MTAHNLKIWSMIQALLVRVEGFKAENASRAARGLSPAYDEAAFFAVEMEIERLAESYEI